MKNKKSIYLTVSEEGDLESNTKGKVVWIHFIGNNGNACGINLNNLASKKGYVSKCAMYEAIGSFIKESD